MGDAGHLLVFFLNLMPSRYQKENLKALLFLFLKAQGNPLPGQSELKSPSALSRFLNQTSWSERQLIREHRRRILKQLAQPGYGRKRKYLQVIIDLTALEKRGRFKNYQHRIHTLNQKRGVQLMTLYLVVGQWRVPFDFRIWRGRGQASPAKLAAKLLYALPQERRRGYRIRVLFDAGITSKWLFNVINNLGFEAIVSIQGRRRLSDGRLLSEVKRRGERVFLTGVHFPVLVSWVTRDEPGQKKRFFVLSTRALSGKHIARWGKRRWQIEVFFKTIKHRLGLHRFGAGTLRGRLRWFILAFTAYFLAYWRWLKEVSSWVLDWGRAAQLALETWLPDVLIELFLIHARHLQEMIPGIRINITVPKRCKM